MIHELQVHQIELEMQNEQLRQTQAELEAALTKYTDFYDFAPVAYLTLDERGLILEANLTAATMLGVERQRFAPAAGDQLYCQGRSEDLLPASPGAFRNSRAAAL